MHTPEQIIEAATEAFFAKVAEMVPNATTGDLGPVATARFARAADNAVREWIRFNTPQPNSHTFLVAITMEEREDGRYDTHMEFGDSYNGSYIAETGKFVDDAGDGPHTAAGITACSSLDAWAQAQRTNVIIDRKEDA